MFKNREIKIFLGIISILCIINIAICFTLNIISGISTAIFSLIFIAATILYTKWRYKKIETLSTYLRKISNGGYALDLREYDEGELSILQSEIYKVTIMLNEQFENVKKDKVFLSDSISNISHQLKTPLTSISMLTQLLCEEGISEDKKNEFLENIQISVERIQWLVTSLLSIAKIDAKVVNFKREHVNISELIHVSCQPFKMVMDDKKQVLNIKGEEGLSLLGDRNWLSEAISNVVKNCVEHTHEGGVISIEFSQNPIYTLIAIKDTGEGIEKKDLIHIFDRFYKTSRGNKDSVGIGLSLSKSIIENQDGTIEVRSEKGIGTEFLIKLYKKFYESDEIVT